MFVLTSPLAGLPRGAIVRTTGRVRVSTLSPCCFGVSTTHRQTTAIDLDAALGGADADELRAFLRDELATDTDLRDRFRPRRRADETVGRRASHTSIDRRFEETNPEYHVVFEPIDFTQWFDLANEHREQGGPRVGGNRLPGTHRVTRREHGAR